jgi:hypothetical protein
MSSINTSANPSFDLDVNHYKVDELRIIFDMTSKYDASVLERNAAILRQNIMADESVDTATKMRTAQFLDDAKKKLITTQFPSKQAIVPKTGIISANEDAVIRDDEPVAQGADENSIIQHKVDPYILSNPSKYFKGQYNPLNKRIIKKSLNIDTRFRENYYQTTPTNFQIDLPMKFNNVLSMQLASLELPTSFYNIDQALGNNFFALIDPVNNITQIITIPDGNYVYGELINQMNKSIYENPNKNISTVIYDVQFTLDINLESGSGRVIAMLQGGSSNSVTLRNFTLNFQTDINGKPDHTTPLPLKFGWMLGFRNGVYSNNLTYVSEGMIDLSSPRYLFLSIDDHNNSVSDGFVSVYSSSMLNKNILARISVRGNVFNFMAQNNLATTTYPREYFGPVNIQRMTIQLLDEYGRILNLHNMDYSFCLTFDTIYDF